MLAGGLVGCAGGPSPQPDSTPGTLPSRPAAVTPNGPAQVFATDATLTLGLAGEPANWNPLAAPAGGDPALAAGDPAPAGGDPALSGGDPALAVVAAAVLPSAFVTGAHGALVRNADLITSATVTSVPVTSGPATSVYRQTVTYELNSRATWSDGVAVTGADFVYTWQSQSGRRSFRDLGGRAYTPGTTAGYAQVASVTSGATNPDQVVVTFSSPDPDWPSLFDPILPAHVGRTVGFDHGFTDPVTSLVSAGPFLVQSYAPGRDVNLVRNPAWWGTAANLAAIDITFVDSPAEAAEGLEQGQLDAAATGFSASAVAALQATAGLSVTVGSGPRYDDLVFDERAGPLSIRAVRLALMIAVDRAGIVRQATSSGDTGAAVVANRVFAPGSTGYRDGTGVLAEGSRALAIGRAEALLTAAGFTRPGTALTYHGTSVHLSLAVASTSPLADTEAASVVVAARALGIGVRIDGSQAAPASGPDQRSDSMVLVQTALTTSPAALSATYGPGPSPSLSHYSSLVMNLLLARLGTVGPGTTGSSAEQSEILDQIDAQAWHDAVDLPLLGVPSVFAYQSRYVDLTGSSSVPGLAGDAARWGIPVST